MALVDLGSGLRDRRAHLIELECLRGVAIWLVVLYHLYSTVFRFGYHDQGHPVPWLFSYVASGRTGVTLFFVLSGFLLSLPFLRAGGEPISLRRFYEARALRILPAYYLAVAVAAVVTGQGGTALRALLFMPVGLEMYPFGLVWWSLSTEAQFYLVLPGLMALLTRRRWRPVGAVLLLVWAAAWLASVLVPAADLGSALKPLRNSLFGRLPAFLAGIGVAAWYVNGRPGAGVLERNRWIATGLGIGLGLALERLLHFSTAAGPWVLNDRFGYWPSLESLCWALMLPVVLVGRPFGRRLLVNPFFAFSGKISYSLFLVHLPVLFYITYPLVGDLGPGEASSRPIVWAGSLAALAASTAVALAGFRWVELPFLCLKERIPRTRPGAGPATSGA